MELGVDEAIRADGSVVVTVTGELDIATAPLLTERLEAIPGVPAIVVDLTPTTFIDSSGLRRLLAAVRGIDVPLSLVCPPTNRPVRMVLELYGLDEAVTVVDVLPPG